MTEHTPEDTEQETKCVRSPDEILERIESLETEDMFGWSRELLIGFLPYEKARRWLKLQVKEEDWKANRRTDPLADLIEYLDFAWTKAQNERGLSANRSVDKIREWLWLAGEDELLARFAAASYFPYGKPRLRVVTQALAPEKLPESE